MLSRKYKLKKDKHFKEVFQKGRTYQNEFIRLRVLSNNLEISRFAFVVGLKVSKKATQRNKIRRRLEEIVRLKINQIKPGFDIVVLVSPEITEKKYQAIEKCLLDLFQRAKII